MASEERLKSILSDLGKATLRGVRKCPKCGTYNGSRGYCCKNKYCDAVFKEAGEKRKLSTEASKLITGSTTQIFSVRARDKDPDYRGFVQLPLNSGEIINLTLSTSLCFINGCERRFDRNVLGKEVQKPLADCQHIQAALRCYAEAQPLTLRNSVLLSLNVSNEIKQEIWLLATETSGPLVQRVSKHMMVVKCKATSKHPLGYLHFSFFMIKVRDKVEHRFFCSCGNFQDSRTSHKVDVNSKNHNIRCVHFYACICAFASDDKLSEEFEYYINLDHSYPTVPKPLGSNLRSNESERFISMDDDEGPTENAHLLILRDDEFTVHNIEGNLNTVNLDAAMLSENINENNRISEQHFFADSNVISQVHNLEIIDQNAVFDGSTVKIISDQAILEKLDQVNSSECVIDDSFEIINTNNVKFLDTNVLLDGNSIRILSENIIPENSIRIIDRNSLIECDTEITKIVNPRIGNSMKRKRIESPSMNTISINNLKSIEPKRVKTKTINAKKYQCSNELIDENKTNQSFINWLASVTERINETMHYQCSGKPDPLVFHVPQKFFECLRERISCGAKKKRLPNSTTSFVRKDGVPIGTFTKYTWQITNILHVKSIFETPLISLEITRSFIQNADGSYQLYKREETDIDRYKKTVNSALIKPMELKTYLKVGNTSPSQVDPTPFLIEWIPDILPISKIGELRIRFEFGHVTNVTPQRCKKVSFLKKY
ncbi:uncharacterized protein C2orf42 homolog [Leptopilina heterotoma]|uniref:uncharacterized protein C2orf42 homolog n=1 Tax=Leptopilina heterotoma TaxID=63436 RepID=UPI001CA84573|nr:uncharacterized protein C2orf42 homolog [Leptopilina heterotoma]